MTQRESMDKLASDIRLLMTLTDDSRDCEIYPVSFFSRAFDLTGRIQEQLHSIELLQIEQLEQQARRHQEQLRNAPARATTAPAAIVPTDVAPAADELPSVPPTPPVAAPPPPPKPTMPEVAAPAPTVIIEKRFEKKTLADVTKSITLNDRFCFCRELFGADEALMTRTLAELNGMESYAQSAAYLSERFSWDSDNETVARFMSVIEKRFNP